MKEDDQARQLMTTLALSAVIALLLLALVAKAAWHFL